MGGRRGDGGPSATRNKSARRTRKIRDCNAPQRANALVAAFMLMCLNRVKRTAREHRGRPTESQNGKTCGENAVKITTTYKRHDRQLVKGAGASTVSALKKVGAGEARNAIK
ncbi:hypothetical protein BaRGS_00031467 [Batillaria attramentaria]|uniref:Uncharacterized protein n=1 Tax=Batillaria attramentaria TaxID=370345 RepID=A0ABD0JRL5_9CAEN